MSPRKEKTYHEFIVNYLKENTRLKLNDETIIVKNRTQRVDFICECGELVNRTPHYVIAYEFKQCKKCNRKIQTPKKTSRLNEIKKYCNENIPHIKLISDEYISVKDELEFYCEVHELSFKKTPYLILLNKNGCYKCFSDSMSSENSRQYNPEISDSQRLKTRKASKIIRWRDKLLKIYDMKCYICNYNKEYNLVAHHKNSHDWCKEQAYDIDNGVILCKNCHSEFHYLYGYGNNTKEQFEEYSKQFKKLE